MTTGGTAPVLFVNAGAERGGAETVLLTLLRHLDRGRFTPLVCCLRDGPLAGEIQRSVGVTVRVVAAGSFRDVGAGLAAVRRLRAVIRQAGAALVHSNGTGAHIYGGLAARVAGVPNLYHVHDAPDPGWNRQGLVGRLARLVPAEIAVTPSRFLTERVARRPIRSAATITVPNGLDPGMAAAIPASARPVGRPPVALWCGRLQRWKGAHVFLRAAAIVRRAVPGARFLIVGGSLMGLEPGYGGELQALARALGLDEAVRFTGHQDDVVPYLAEADVVVHSSIAPEPFGLVALEAMMAARPVIASDEGGPREIVEPGVSGLLVPPGDAGALAAAILRVFGDPELGARMGEAGRARAAREFSAETMTRRFERIYAELIERARRREGIAA